MVLAFTSRPAQPVGFLTPDEFYHRRQVQPAPEEVAGSSLKLSRSGTNVTDMFSRDDTVSDTDLAEAALKLDVATKPAQ